MANRNAWLARAMYGALSRFSSTVTLEKKLKLEKKAQERSPQAPRPRVVNKKQQEQAVVTVRPVRRSPMRFSSAAESHQARPEYSVQVFRSITSSWPFTTIVEAPARRLRSRPTTTHGRRRAPRPGSRECRVQGPGCRVQGAGRCSTWPGALQGSPEEIAVSSRSAPHT
jgi:hypothetical protein